MNLEILYFYTEFGEGYKPGKSKKSEYRDENSLNI